MSVLLPCWNALALTRVCVAQLQASAVGFELVAVDDGSTDGTWAWLRRRAAAAPGRVRLRRHRRNRGYAAAMNTALAAARGELVVLANADAAPGAGWLEEMSALFDARPKLGGLAPRCNPPASDAGPWDARWYRGPARLALFAAAWALRPGPRFVPAAGFVPGFWFMSRAAALRRLGGFDEGYGRGGYEDWDLQMRLREAGWDIGFAGRVYVHHGWGGVFRANGLDPAASQEPGRARLAKTQPSAARARLKLLTPR